MWRIGDAVWWSRIHEPVVSRAAARDMSEVIEWEPSAERL